MPKPDMKNMAMPMPAHKVSPFELLPLFENRTLKAVDGEVGDLNYYIYDPVAHGADPNGKYPMILYFHGSQMNLFENAAILATDMGIFASKEYQNLLGGNCYVVLPRANESREPNGFVKGSWGFWNGRDRVTERSVYLSTLKALVDELCASGNVDPKRIAVGGCSAGGLMCWQFTIAYPDLCAASFPVAPIYIPTDEELDLLQEKKVPVWLVHGKDDELARFDQLAGAIMPSLKAHDNVRVTVLDTVRYGDGRVVMMNMGKEVGQHQAQFAIGQNMLYNDGTPYDEAYPDGFIAWVNEAFANNK